MAVGESDALSVIYLRSEVNAAHFEIARILDAVSNQAKFYGALMARQFQWHRARKHPTSFVACFYCEPFRLQYLGALRAIGEIKERI